MARAKKEKIMSNDKSSVHSSDLLASVKISFEIATSALVQAKTNLGLLGFERTKNEVASVVDDLRKATKQLEANKDISPRLETTP